MYPGLSSEEKVFPRKYPTSSSAGSCVLAGTKYALGALGSRRRPTDVQVLLFRLSRFLERKGYWQRSSLTCRAAERATRAASQFYALRPRTASLHTSPHPPEDELRRDAGLYPRLLGVALSLCGALQERSLVCR